MSAWIKLSQTGKLFSFNLKVLLPCKFANASPTSFIRNDPGSLDSRPCRCRVGLSQLSTSFDLATDARTARVKLVNRLLAIKSLSPIEEISSFECSSMRDISRLISEDVIYLFIRRSSVQLSLSILIDSLSLSKSSEKTKSTQSISLLYSIKPFKSLTSWIRPSLPDVQDVLLRGWRERFLSLVLKLPLPGSSSRIPLCKPVCAVVVRSVSFFSLHWRFNFLCFIKSQERELQQELMGVLAERRFPMVCLSFSMFSKRFKKSLLFFYNVTDQLLRLWRLTFKFSRVPESC